jgi:glycosyltransferase involved in cell wall biosynthesis
MQVEQPVMTDKLYLVTPVYNDRQSLGKLLSELTGLHDSRGPLHVVVVDDGSLKEPVIPANLEDHPFQIDLITLKRNVGHQRAIAIGLSHLTEKDDVGKIVVMDGDGEDPPESITLLLDTFDNNECDVVVAQRRKREESRAFKFFYKIYKYLFHVLTGEFIKFGNFCVMSKAAATRLVHMDELWMHFPAAIIKSGLVIEPVNVDRGRRYYGSSKMNMVSLITHGLRSVAIFTESVLTRIILFCALIAGSSILLILSAFIIKLLGFATPGWFTVAVGALLGLLVQTATITLISLLIAMNSRNSTALIPLKISKEYVDKVISI